MRWSKFEELRKLELQRLDIIKRGLSKYMAKMGEVYGKTTINPDIAIKVMEALNPN